MKQLEKHKQKEAFNSEAIGQEAKKIESLEFDQQKQTVNEIEEAHNFPGSNRSLGDDKTHSQSEIKSNDHYKSENEPKGAAAIGDPD